MEQQKPVKEYSLNEVIDVYKKIGDIIAEEMNKGKTWVWIDKKLVQWLDEQVEAGKYDSASHAIEVLILEKMKKG